MSKSKQPERALETSRLLLEPLREHHAAHLFPILSDPRIYSFIPQDPRAAVSELQATYKRLEARHSPDGDEIWLNWAIYLKAEGQYIGTVQATIDERLIGKLAYLLNPKFWGDGYATEACRETIKSLFTDYKVSEIIAEVDTRNVASYGLLERLSFERVMTKARADHFKGANSDEYIYQLKPSAA